MKILHIASGDRWGGAEAQILTLLTHLRRNPALQVHIALLNDRELAQRLRAQGIEVTILDEERLGAAAIAWELRRLMLRWRPDVVHTHRQKENVLGAIANRLATQAATVRTSHGAPEHPPRGISQIHRRLFYWLDDWCGRHWQDRIIAVSQDLAGQLADRFPSQRIVVIENGVDSDAVNAAITPVDFRTKEPQACHIGLVGRLDPVKRVDIFLEMAAQLLRDHPGHPWRFHIFGDGKLRHPLESQALALGIQDAVRFHGHRDDIIACLAGLDGLVMCSDHEGLPMTVLESLTVKTPIVGHAVGGIAQVLQGTSLGKLVYDHQASAYADAVVEVLLGNAPTSTAPATAMLFTADRNQQEMTRLYSLLSTRSSQPVNPPPKSD